METTYTGATPHTLTNSTKHLDAGIHCSGCGAPVPEDMKYCPKCGEPQRTSRQAPTHSTPTDRRKIEVNWSRDALGDRYRPVVRRDSESRAYLQRYVGDLLAAYKQQGWRLAGPEERSVRRHWAHERTGLFGMHKRHVLTSVSIDLVRDAAHNATIEQPVDSLQSRTRANADPNGNQPLPVTAEESPEPTQAVSVATAPSFTDGTALAPASQMASPPIQPHDDIATLSRRFPQNAVWSEQYVEAQQWVIDAAHVLLRDPSASIGARAELVAVIQRASEALGRQGEVTASHQRQLDRQRAMKLRRRRRQARLAPHRPVEEPS